MGRRLAQDGVGLKRPFKRPTKTEERFALGGATGVWENMLDCDGIPPIPKPRGDAWLNVVEERGQTVTSFRRLHCRAALHSSYRTVFLQPVAWASEDPVVAAAPLRSVEAYLRAFFPGVSTAILRPLVDAAVKLGRNHPEEGHPQFLTSDMYEALRRVRGSRELARTCVAVLGISTADLYPGEEWDHVCGEALPLDSVAIVSWFRHGRFDQGKFSTSEGDKTPAPDLVLRRVVSTLSHELCHLFGLHHCIYRHCLMNGTNHQAENDARPTMLCTVCLRKLYIALTEVPGVSSGRDGSIGCLDDHEHGENWLAVRFAELQAWHDEHDVCNPQLARISEIIAAASTPPAAGSGPIPTVGGNDAESPSLPVPVP